MQYRPENPLIVQADQSLLLETMNPHFAEVRDALARFAELVKSPDYIHTWRITPLSLWNGAAAGLRLEDILDTLQRWSKYDVPASVPVWVRETLSRYGRLELRREGGALLLVADGPALMTEVRSTRGVSALLGKSRDNRSIEVDQVNRGLLKQVLIAHGYPVDDRAGYVDGDTLALALRTPSLDGRDWSLRQYQCEAVSAFYGENGGGSGSGVIVLPCGAGKTIVGISVMERLQMRTLILGTNVTALRQWRDEIIARTSLGPDEVGEYSGERKDIRPVTLTTYQMLTWRPSKEGDFVHLGLFDSANWGLIIYDEVHLLPAPVFRVVANLQARRRLGLTATLVREDGKEGDVFALIGPKRFDMPWKDLEGQGWIASAVCTEIRVGMGDEERLAYAIAEDRERFRVASTNPRKLDTIAELLERHAGSRTLIIGMYVDQLKEIAHRWSLPLITGETKQSVRDGLFERFRDGSAPVLVISRVGNFSVDLPDANVAIQVSGTWGSRQEEAQRLGRVLRPKPGQNTADFYTVVSRDTVEQEFSEKRQLFLTEQGYNYRIEAED